MNSNIPVNDAKLYRSVEERSYHKGLRLLKKLYSQDSMNVSLPENASDFIKPSSFGLRRFIYYFLAKFLKKCFICYFLFFRSYKSINISADKWLLSMDEKSVAKLDNPPSLTDGLDKKTEQVNYNALF